MRPSQYALALATKSAVGADVFALHECDNPVCVKVSGPGALRAHVVAGTQFETTCGAWREGGRPTIRRLGREARRARSVALREAVQGRSRFRVCSRHESRSRLWREQLPRFGSADG